MIKKSAPKTVKKPMAKKPAVKVTKPRGSNTPKQVGDMNQREWYNGKGKYDTDANGQLLKVSKSDRYYKDIDRASSQRAGGKSDVKPGVPKSVQKERKNLTKKGKK